MYSNQSEADCSVICASVCQTFMWFLYIYPEAMSFIIHRGLAIRFKLNRLITEILFSCLS